MSGSRPLTALEEIAQVGGLVGPRGPRFVLITGASGVGKTWVVNGLRREVVYSHDHLIIDLDVIGFRVGGAWVIDWDLMYAMAEAFGGKTIVCAGVSTNVVGAPFRWDLIVFIDPPAEVIARQRHERGDPPAKVDLAGVDSQGLIDLFDGAQVVKSSTDALQLVAGYIGE